MFLRQFVRRSSHYHQVYRSSIDQPDKFWAEQAANIDWFKKSKKIFEKNDPIRPNWFQDGILNMTFNCLDRHLSKRADQLAIIADSAMTGKISSLTYRELHDQVQQLSNALTEQYRVKKGDVVLIYMPMISQAIVAMLACARIGAIHNVVFGGFSSNELAVRIKHSEPKIILSGFN